MKLLNKYEKLPVGVRASFWFLICGFFQKGMAVITTPIFTRLLSTDEYGQFSVFCSWQSILTVFVTLNLAGGVYTNGLVKHKNFQDKFISSMQGLTLSLVVFWLIIYLVLREYINNLLGLNTIQIISMFILMWIGTISAFWSTELRMDMKYRFIVILTLVVAVVRPTIGIALVSIYDDKVTARIIGMVVVDCIAYGWVLLWHFKKGRCFYDKKIWKHVISFNIPLIPHYLSMNILNAADRIMIDKMTGVSQAGIYNLAYSLAQIMTIFNSAMLQTIDPWLYKKIGQKETKDIPNIAYIVFSLICVANILLIALAPEAVSIFAPKSYYDAKYIIPAVAMSVPFMFTYNFFATFEFSYEKNSYITLATIISAIINILLNYIFIPRFGYYAAGYTTLLCYILLSFIHYYFMNKICKEHNIDNLYDLKKLLTIFGIFLSTGIVFLISYENDFVRYSLLVIMIGIIILKRKLIMNTINKILILKQDH